MSRETPDVAELRRKAEAAKLFARPGGTDSAIVTLLAADMLGLLDQLGAAEARLAAVRGLHWPQPYADADLRAASPSLPKEVCAHCRSTGDGAIPWPCPTIRAIGAES